MRKLLNTIQEIISLLSILLVSDSVSLHANTLAIDCEVLKHSTVCEIINDKLVQTDSIILQINNRNGENYTDISIPYSKSEKISGIEGWIEDETGRKVRTLKNSDIHDKSKISDISLFEDHYEKTFQLKFNTYPYRICYTYRIVYNSFTTMADWAPELFSKIPTKEARLIVKVPQNYPIKKYVRNVEFTRTDTLEKNIEYEFVSKYKAINQDEIFAEPYSNIEPKVVIVPLKFIYGINGSNDNWMTYGNWVYNLNYGLNDLPEREKIIVNNLILGLSDKKEIVRTLYHYLQDHTRYINISIGVGGYKSYPASYVSENKYGDCKALTNYMKSLLEFAGIKSYFTLINASLQPVKLIEDLPFPQFNHMILAVPIDRDTLWIDNTSNSGPFAYVGSYLQNRKALFIDENRSRPINMPEFNNEDVKMVRKFNVSINESGNAEAQIVFSFGGFLFECFNELKTQNTPDEQDKIVRDYMPFTNFDILNWDLNKLDRDTARIELVSTLNIYKLLKPVGNDVYFNIFPVRILNFKSPAERNLPLQFPYPVNNVDSLTYSVPEGSYVKSVPEPVDLSSAFGKYEARITLKENKIYVFKKFELFPATYPIEKYKDFYKYINMVKEADKITLILVKKT
jgi:hypothetical protein